MGKALILDPGGWLSLEQWKARKKPVDGWRIDLEEVEEAYDLVFLVREAVGLTRETIADWCARRGLNPLSVVPFPCPAGETGESEGLLDRWNEVFDQTVQAWKTAPRVEAKRLYPSRRVCLVPAEGTEHDGERMAEAMKARGLDVSVLPGDGFLSRSGLDFRVISTEGTDPAGAVVFVPKIEERFTLPVPEEVTDTRRVITLTELEKKMRFRRFRLEQVVFIVPQVITPPVLWERVYRLARDLAAQHGARVAVLCAETVVAGDALEIYYRQARQAGALFEKVNPETMTFRPTMDMRKVIIRFVTERDLFETELASHWIVTVPQWRTLPVDPGRLFVEDRIVPPLIRPENVNLDVYALNEPGMFLFPPWLSTEELDSALRDLERYLDQGVVGEQGRMEVDEEKCVLCLTCLRICPWGAVNIEGDSKRRKAQVRWELCRVCGLCASSCPASAIAMAGLLDWDRDPISDTGGGAR